ncbi:hypothetical protein LCGC14_0370430 [marine sediment metagenome]|uniref:Uncharacterized protein n=1 Tax=marine sediment metagenome TaxID=412755 RepID=A0A0F9TN54_9ZZZZ
MLTSRTVLSQPGNDSCRDIKENYSKTILIAQDLKIEVHKRDTIIDLQGQQIKKEKKLGNKKRNRWIKIATIEGVLLVLILLL